MTKSILLFIFFFSSRRRHTRSLRDWSSDVCSSDLNHRILPAGIEIKRLVNHTVKVGHAVIRFYFEGLGILKPCGSSIVKRRSSPAHRAAFLARREARTSAPYPPANTRSEEHTSELQSRRDLVC